MFKRSHTSRPIQHPQTALLVTARQLATTLRKLAAARTLYWPPSSLPLSFFAHSANDCTIRAASHLPHRLGSLGNVPNELIPTEFA